MVDDTSLALKERKGSTAVAAAHLRWERGDSPEQKLLNHGLQLGLKIALAILRITAPFVIA